MKSLAFALCLLAPVSSCAPLGKHGDIDPPAVTKWLRSRRDIQVVDVRTREEFAQGHLAHARLIPWTDPDFSTRVRKELDPENPVLVYCRSGRRSGLAATQLRKEGFEDVRNLKGGILAWQSTGQPTTQSE